MKIWNNRLDHGKVELFEYDAEINCNIPIYLLKWCSDGKLEVYVFSNSKKITKRDSKKNWMGRLAQTNFVSVFKLCEMLQKFDFKIHKWEEIKCATKQGLP